MGGQFPLLAYVSLGGTRDLGFPLLGVWEHTCRERRQQACHLQSLRGHQEMLQNLRNWRDWGVWGNRRISLVLGVYFLTWIHV